MSWLRQPIEESNQFGVIEVAFNEIDALIIATLIYEDVANICPTLMLDEQQQSGSFATRIRVYIT